MTEKALLPRGRRLPLAAGVVLVVLAVLMTAAVVGADDDGSRAAGPELRAAATTTGTPATTTTRRAGTQARPAGFTACLLGYDKAGVITKHERGETVTVATGAGRTTEVRFGGGRVIPLEVSDVTDPRLQGDWRRSFNAAELPEPFLGASAAIVTSTILVTNGGGAWRGTHTFTRFGEDPDPGYQSHVVLTGEGGYRGAQAVLTISIDPWLVDPGRNDVPCPNLRGVVVPAGLARDLSPLAR